MPSCQYLSARNYRRERWRNEQGWTREITRHPDLVDYHWRVSIAEITQDTQYSTFPGYQRWQVLLHGCGLRLQQIGNLTDVAGSLRFDGSDTVQCQLLDGPVSVLNLIWDASRFSAQFLHRPLVGTMLFLPEPNVTWFVYLAAGQAQIRSGQALFSLQMEDSLIVKPVPGERMVLEGAGDLLLFRLMEKHETMS